MARGLTPPLTGSTILSPRSRKAAGRAHAALQAVDDALQATGAELLSLSIRPVAAQVEAVLRVSGLDDAAARGLSDRLAHQPGVIDTRVEHCWVRP